MITNTEKYNVICFSNQLWDFPNWTNKKHVMHRLSLQGHHVLFVDPPINFGWVLLKQIKRGFWGLQRLLTQTKKDSDGVLVFNPINLLPFPDLTSKIHAFRIKKLAAKNFDSSRKTLLWVYHVQLPNLEYYIQNLKHDVLIYDCVDNYAGFPEEKAFYRASVYADTLLQQEEKLARAATIVFASAPGLADRLGKINSNTHFTPNVGDYAEFHDTKKYTTNIPEDLKEIPRPRIGFIGAMDSYKFDYDLVEKLAQDYPKYNFVLIGPLALKDKNAKLEDLPLAQYPNIFLLGSRPYNLKKYYMAGFDVDIIPYVISDYTVGGCFPVKFHDSLAAGMPVVVTDLPAYAPFSKVCYISKTYGEFSNNLKKAMEEDSPQKIKERQKVAKENDWEGKVSNMLSLIETALANS